jgi:hypothetical protein
MDWCDNEHIAVDDDEQEAINFYRFLRVGEETDDNVARGWAFSDVCIERSIAF